MTINTTYPHLLETGWSVMISGVSGNPEANGGPFTVTKIDDDTFTIPVGDATPETGTGGSFELVTATNGYPIVFTSRDHTLETGASVKFSGISGNTVPNNNTYSITKLNAHQFGITATGNGNGTGGK